MGETTKKILFVSSEMVPYLPDSEIGTIGRFLPQGVQDRKREIRTFLPRYGCINERKNQLHEVIRLSGINLIIDGVDHLLTIKVASIPAAKMQVYFIDNEEFFKRKQTFTDAEGKFFEDNDERAIFYARAVLETVKKLRWEPDVIHCEGWISHLLPVYLKKAYKDDPIFTHSKVVVSLYDDLPDGFRFRDGFAKRALFGGATEKDLSLLEDPTGINLAKTAARYADGVILGSANLSPLLVGYCRDRGLKVLRYNAKSLASGSYIEEYNDFYDQI